MAERRIRRNQARREQIVSDDEVTGTVRKINLLLVPTTGRYTAGLSVRVITGIPSLSPAVG